jgi:hypothetical protein
MHKNDTSNDRKFDDNKNDFSPTLSTTTTTTLSDMTTTITTLNDGKSGNNYYDKSTYINSSLSSSYSRMILALKNYSLE